jgi:hypothetical protein
MSQNGTFAKTYERCTELSELCPVEATVLGYNPNLAANAFFTAAFGITMLATFAIGFWKRTWSFAVAVGCGALLETAGEFLCCAPSYEIHESCCVAFGSEEARS